MYILSCKWLVRISSWISVCLTVPGSGCYWLDRVPCRYGERGIRYRRLRSMCHNFAVRLSGHICCSTRISLLDRNGRLLNRLISRREREGVWVTCFVRFQSAVFLLLLAIPQIVSTIMFVHQFEVKSAQTTVELAWQANNMDGLQQKYECCGKSSAQDYVHLRQLIPPSCYIDLDQKPEHLYVEGCIEKLQSRYESDKLRFIIVSWVLVAFEVTIDPYFQVVINF